MFKNIIFDWSGPIKDIVEQLSWVLGKMFSLRGLKQISVKEMRENWEQPYMKFWDKYCPGLTLQEEHELYCKVIANPEMPKSKPHDGILDLLRKLKERGVAMTILSSDPPEILYKEIKDWKLEGFFQEVADNVHDKEEVIHEMLKRNNFDPAETVFIGDSNHEIEAGRSAGVKTISVVWGFTTEERLKKVGPDYLVHNIEELEEILLK